MSALQQHLLSRIAADGPITVADYMSECLLQPQHGYYATRDPFGARGDFTTAPEISQMFGEVLGLCLAQSWLDQGAPSAFVLAEPGPGRGTLMADILRATRRVPGFHEAAQIHLIEASASLRAVQKGTLKGFQVHWNDRLDQLPQAPLFLVANEFFDALPIRQFVRAPNGWRERRIGIRDNALTFGTDAIAPVQALAHRLTDTQEGDMVEISPASESVTQEISERIANHGGAAAIIDYGGWKSLGDTLQAVKDHSPIGVLDEPGESDLTAHVDFEAIARNALDVQVSGMTRQGVLLERLGITQRARLLAETLSGEALESHIAAHRRLTHPDEMGTLFKAIALSPKGSPPPPGFNPAGENT